jgi:hypothetical protein
MSHAGAWLLPLAVLDIRGDGALAIYENPTWRGTWLLAREGDVWVDQGISVGPGPGTSTPGVSRSWTMQHRRSPPESPAWWPSVDTVCLVATCGGQRWRGPVRNASDEAIARGRMSDEPTGKGKPTPASATAATRPEPGGPSPRERVDLTTRIGKGLRAFLLRADRTRPASSGSRQAAW